MNTKLFRKVGIIIIVTAIILSAVFANMLLSFNTQVAFAEESIAENSAASEVVSYKDVFRSYYNQAIEQSEELGNEDICGFEEFCEGYYSSNMDLTNYTSSVISDENGQEQIDTRDTLPESRTPANGDANYILSSTSYDSTPASEFARVPVYSMYDYSAVKAGDIIHETDTIFWNAGHTAIIYDTSKSSAYGNYIQAIEAVGGGVQYGFLDDTRMVDFGVIILRVTGATSKIDDVKSFCLDQIGKPYFLNPLRKVSERNIDSSNWYCSEMVYVAYRDGAGIDIGVKKNSAGQDVYLQLGCIPSDIFNSYNTSPVAAQAAGYLEISIINKSGTNWTIEVTNNFSQDIIFEYNGKMCFYDDAKNWTGLKDIKIKEVPANSSVSIVISENFFATSITICWVNKTNRLITYGTNLKTNTSMTVGYVTK